MVNYEQRLIDRSNNGEIELVMCAANYYNDGKKYVHQPNNIDTGYVICGWRHHSCGFSYLAANKEATKWDNCIQGFLTTKNRFLNRDEALKLVISTGQHNGNIIGSVLSSEDLW